MNPARILTQVVVVGVQIVGRAFVDAYKAAAQNAAKNAVSAGGAAAGDLLSRKTGMTLDEAALILNVDKKAPLKDINEKYEHMFQSNSPEKGGSFYLQSKVFRAKERMELELQKLAAESNGSAGPQDPSAPTNV
ncbi:Pam16-domain-containing protein [Entophlyctis helioformis]|nr:Pam16-domain-containing protein [Entophlyctis helioformis]